MKFEEVVNEHYDSLNESELHILSYVMNNKEQSSSLSINELAKKCNVSKSSLLRFTKKIGFSGYSEFKFYIKWEKEERQSSVEDKDITQSLIKDIELTLKHINLKQIDEICEVLYKARRIFFYGTGYSQMNVIKDLQRSFMSINEYFYIIHDNEQIESIVEDLTFQDVVIIISLSGNSKTLFPIMKKLNAKKVKVISITNLEANYLSSMAPYNLYVTVARVKTQIRELTTFIPFYIMGEVLCRQYLIYKLKKDKKYEKEN
ncbi:HTH-type transcriptional regulator GlvR [compost metagenome]